MSQFHDALALATLMAEKTGCTIEMALKNLMLLSSGDCSTSAFNKPRYSTEEIVKVKHTLSITPHSYHITPKEVAENAGIIYKGGKTISYIMISLGWVRTGFKRDSVYVYKKEKTT